jgi:hypothetical protein
MGKDLAISFDSFRQSSQALHFQFERDSLRTTGFRASELDRLFVYFYCVRIDEISNVFRTFEFDLYLSLTDWWESSS